MDEGGLPDRIYSFRFGNGLWRTNGIFHELHPNTDCPWRGAGGNERVTNTQTRGGGGRAEGAEELYIGQVAYKTVHGGHRGPTNGGGKQE